MSNSIKYIEVGSLDHRNALDSLFQEYSSGVSASIDSTIVSQLLELPYFRGFLCFADNKPAGFAVCFESYSTYRARKVLNIHDFMVSNRYCGKGLAKSLLASIEQYCFENDYLKITLEVDDDNKIAQRLYESCGFEDFQVVLKGLNHWQKYLV
ncbi:GNAT family N-acetyltransferase [Alginatibacterium sediminis]|uniref:GNAT family N-acetyltransferase n=1 Tax=Alginatibacterium sediminis TaxID=2164068 RepID=A0A420E9N9_9ALTE|nr:GNAT family N-acetyltransferase [Alginatibacterium sediminis]RKF17390.1 GNAT family N-acetyltransferase [Alginatibacterium sediminis]